MRWRGGGGEWGDSTCRLYTYMYFVNLCFNWLLISVVCLVALFLTRLVSYTALSQVSHVVVQSVIVMAWEFNFPTQ